MTAAGFVVGLTVGVAFAAAVGVAATLAGLAIGAAVTWDRPKDLVPNTVPEAWLVTT